jgi:dTDP-4-amino-4,6-dideoxygalactose transaminase
MGTSYRVSEITGAILRVQLGRLDGILEDLRRVKKTIMTKLAGLKGLRFTPSHDPEGDCGTTLGFTFADPDAAAAFAKSEGVNGWLPINSDKHVYTNWTPLLEKRGAHVAARDPYRLAENQGLRMQYSRGMCQKTLDILARTVYINMNPDWTDEKVQDVVDSCRKAAEALK